MIRLVDASTLVHELAGKAVDKLIEHSAFGDAGVTGYRMRRKVWERPSGSCLQRMKAAHDMNEIQRHIRKLAICDANRRVLQAQEQFAVPRQDDCDPFADALRRLEDAEKTLKPHH